MSARKTSTEIVPNILDSAVSQFADKAGQAFLQVMQEKVDPTACVQALMSAYQDYKTTCEVQQTKRDAIQADKEKALAAIKGAIKAHRRNSDRLFSQADKALDVFLQEFSKACESGNSEALQASFSGVLGTLKQSSDIVASGVNLWQDMHNPNIQQLEDL
ncbi:MAG: hypothetical protein IJM64_01510 [Ottowia sp.]|nr:hypothetical protein [Ottowia sp.]